MDIERLSPRTLLLVAVLGGLSFQLLLGTSYVAAFLDPVGQSTGVPVGFVNADEGPHGAEFTSALVAYEGPVTWKPFEGRAQLERAMLSKSVHGGLVVPGNFSAALDSFASRAPRAATVELLLNPGASATGSVVGERALNAAVAALEARVQEEALAQADAADAGLGVVTLAQARVLTDPVRTTTRTVNPVPVEGATGLAPTYLAMACWIGGYLGSAALERFRPRTRLAPPRRVLLSVAAASVQAVAAVAALALVGFDMRDPTALLLVVAAGTWMAYAIVSLCMDLFGLVGVLPAFAMLSLGLPASGAIYPYEMLAPFYKALHAVDPFVWLVEALRTILYAPGATDAAGHVASLLAAGAVASLLSLLVHAARGRRTPASADAVETPAAEA